MGLNKSCSSQQKTGTVLGNFVHSLQSRRFFWSRDPRPVVMVVISESFSHAQDLYYVESNFTKLPEQIGAA